MARRNLPSISTPIILASIALPIAIALLVGWTLVFAGNLAQGGDVSSNVWILVSGVVAFIALMLVMVMFAIYLGREILEVRRQDIFIDSVTHELKSPLASIKLGLQTLARRGVDDDKRELLRQMMLEDVDRLSGFVDDILQASRLASDVDRMGMHLSMVSLRELAEECVESVCNRRKLDDETVVIDIQPELELHTDRAALMVVVRNLIDNAIKYSNPPVTVTIKARREDDETVIIEVRDEGIGIPDKEIKRVFQRFYRVASEGVRTRRGTGLGLYVVMQLVRNLGGRIDAESVLGEGTIMTVRLPLTSPGDEVAA